MPNLAQAVPQTRLINVRNCAATACKLQNIRHEIRANQLETLPENFAGTVEMQFGGINWQI